MRPAHRNVAAALVLLLTLSFLSTKSSADDKYLVGIAGRVTTMDGALVSRAEIQISRGWQKPLTKTMTDSNGEYSIELKPGIYNVVVEQPGFKLAKRKGIKVDAKGRVIVDFVLQMGAAERVE